MDRIGVRELRQHASRWLSRVAAGETIEVSDRGRLVAILAPPREIGARDRLLAAGHLIPATGELRKISPLPAASVRRSLSNVLTELRDEER